ncbi:hypothetical protein [Rhodopirellula sallentina]|uniref:hypothetical protein n=1 Tax=Rhodopirellula sallentina TaxID=1263869 RepID=UPI0003453229|nr:hypothetical protein [Rhodopirellula sallentina]
MAFTTTIENDISRILIRYFRTGDVVETLTGGTFNLADDLEFLRIHWALSREIESLAEHLLERRHEAQATLEVVRKDISATIKGRLDVARTIMRRRLTGDVSQVSFYEPCRSFLDGPNHVLSWVLRYCGHILTRYVTNLNSDDAYGIRCRKITGALNSIQQIAGIGDAISRTGLSPRPSVKSVIQAGQSRRWLYRKAFAAYQRLLAVERGDLSKTMEMLNGSLIGPMATWQKFELLLGLRIAESLSKSTKVDLTLCSIKRGGGSPLAVVGPYEIYWQQRTPLARPPNLEPSEKTTKVILESYGVGMGGDRPDIVVCDTRTNTIAAIAEAKYSESTSAAWEDSFRDATTQLVRYSRLYSHHTPQDQLLRRSVLAISSLPSAVQNRTAHSMSPIAIGLNGLVEGRLDEWANRLSSHPSLLPS